MAQTPTSVQLKRRPPVVAIMGHIDHGKSTLLDYIRSTNIADTEAGGITQKIAAYEVVHTTKEGKEEKITFIDTPGHEAFEAMRSQGVGVADVAVLVVAADDGVKPQTLEALKQIREAKIPYIVALNKIDKPGANVEWAKQNLAENEIYIEGYGGTIPSVALSAKTGEGVPELLDMILLVAELEELTGDESKAAEGVVIEAKLDKKKGITATLIIKNGSLTIGKPIIAGSALSPGRIVENFTGKKIASASFSSPVSIVGWSELPPVGASFKTFPTKKEAERYIDENKHIVQQKRAAALYEPQEGKVVVPVIIKANVSGGLEAIEHEIKKLETDKVSVRIVQGSIGDISESDIKIAIGTTDSIILGFNTKIDPAAKSLAERLGVEVQTFDVIYKLAEYLQTIINARTPAVEVEHTLGIAKILKFFSKTKDRQVLGGRVENGIIKVGAVVKILRRENEIDKGIIRELQQQKVKTSEIGEGREFGALVESKTEIAPGDRIECIEVTRQ